MTNTDRSTVASTGAASACASRPVAASAPASGTARRRAAPIPARSDSGAGPETGPNPATWSWITDSKYARRNCPSHMAFRVSRRSACASVTTASSVTAASSSPLSPAALAASSWGGLTRLPW